MAQDPTPAVTGKHQLVCTVHTVFQTHKKLVNFWPLFGLVSLWHRLASVHKPYKHGKCIRSLIDQIIHFVLNLGLATKQLYAHLRLLTATSLTARANSARASGFSGFSASD